MITIAGLSLEHFHFIAGLRERIARLEQNKTDYEDIHDEVNSIGHDVRELKTKVDLFWGALETQLPEILLKGNPLEKGSRVATLLEQFGKRTLNFDDFPELILLLEGEVHNDQHTAGEKLAMILMMTTVKAKVSNEGEKRG